MPHSWRLAGKALVVSMLTSMPRPTALPWTAVWSSVTLGHPVNINGTWKIPNKSKEHGLGRLGFNMF
jgi:hypothetical protein